MSENLKPCPFCNRKLIEHEALSNRNAKCFGHPVNSDDEDDCIISNIVVWLSDRDEHLERAAAWNRRESLTTAEAENASLTEAAIVGEYMWTPAELGEAVREARNEALEEAARRFEHAGGVFTSDRIAFDIRALAAQEPKP